MIRIFGLRYESYNNIVERLSFDHIVESAVNPQKERIDAALERVRISYDTSRWPVIITTSKAGVALCTNEFERIIIE